MTGVGQRGSVPCAASRWHVACVQNHAECKITARSMDPASAPARLG